MSLNLFERCRDRDWGTSIHWFFSQMLTELLHGWQEHDYLCHCHCPPWSAGAKTWAQRPQEGLKLTNSHVGLNVLIRILMAKPRDRNFIRASCVSDRGPNTTLHCPP